MRGCYILFPPFKSKAPNRSSLLLFLLITIAGFTLWKEDLLPVMACKTDTTQSPQDKDTFLPLKSLNLPLYNSDFLSFLLISM